MLHQLSRVYLCLRHYHTPRLPAIPGMETFPGLQLHSHAYRVPDTMVGKTVVVLGAGPSGLDLALEISKVAKQVGLSVRTSFMPFRALPSSFNHCSRNEAALISNTGNEPTYLPNSASLGVSK